MAELFNRVRVNTSTVGTGTITLGTALAGYCSFADAGVQSGATVSYCLEDGSNFEIGRGVYNSGALTLTRGAIILSKVAGSAADTTPLVLSGTAVVFITAAAEDLLTRTAALTDNAILRGDGGAAGTQTSGITIDDNNFLGGADGVGIGGATADVTNRLSANTPAVLFNRETDDIQVKLNKAAAGDTASFLFQTGFSGRAEIGIVGSDDFVFKVSPDGSSFFTGISIDKDDGAVTFPVSAATVDEAYNATTWNGSLTIPTKNAIRDYLETLTGTTLPATYQPLDADLTAIAGVATASYGRNLLALANATALAAEVDSFFLTPTEGNAAYQPVDADLTAIAALSTQTTGRSLLTLTALAGALETSGTTLRVRESFVIACSDETSNLTTGTAKVTFRMPYAFTLTEVRASVNTAPVGSTIIVDINDGGSTIMTTNKLSIDASEKTSTTAATPAGLTDTSLADDAEITIDIDQIGSSTAGKGLKVALIGYRP